MRPPVLSPMEREAAEAWAQSMDTIMSPAARYLSRAVRKLLAHYDRTQGEAPAMSGVLTPEELRLYQRWVAIEKFMRAKTQTLEDEKWWSAAQERMMRIHEKLLRWQEAGHCCDEQRRRPRR